MNGSIRVKALVWMAAVGVSGIACSSEDPTPPASESSSSSGDSGSGATSTTPGATGQANTGLDSTSGAMSEDGMADGSFLNPTDEGSGDGPAVPQPNGAECGVGQDCESTFCYPIPMAGGRCSECLMDQDCESGTCAIGAEGYAVCTDGSIGLMCNTDEGCMGELICAQVIDTGGFFPDTFCSECRDDTPCAEGLSCAPVYDLQNVGGYLGCLEPESVDNGGGCALNDDDTGDGTVCISGVCERIMALGLIPLGICGECVTDADCEVAGLTTCTPGVVDMTGIMPSTCS